MAILLVLILLFFAVLSVLYAAGTLFLQAYIYSQPTEGLLWRAPAAAGAISVFLFMWVLLDYNAPGKYRTVFEFSPREDLEPFEELRVVNALGKEESYQRLSVFEGGDEYRLDGKRSGKLFPSQPTKIIVMEEEQKVIFEPDEQGKGQYRQYVDPKGRTIVEGAWNQVSYFRTSWMFGNLLINFLFFAILFVSIWLLLNYQWHHGFGLAAALWGIMILFVIPVLLNRTERIAIEAGIPRVTQNESHLAVSSKSPNSSSLRLSNAKSTHSSVVNRWSTCRTHVETTSALE